MILLLVLLFNHLAYLIELEVIVGKDLLEALALLIVDVENHLQVAVVHCLDRLGHDGPDSPILLCGFLPIQKISILAVLTSCSLIVHFKFLISIMKNKNQTEYHFQL